MERIHKVLGNLVRKYNIHEECVDETDPWMGILATYYFAVLSMYHRTKGKCPGQLVIT